MGIKDLLKFMKPYTVPIHVKKYSGKRVGIDAYSWLHKGAYSCSMELCLDSNSGRKLRYLDYFMHRINLLRHHGVTPVVVLDGGSIPCKSSTELDRHRRREGNRELAMEKLKEGNVTAAAELFQRAVSVTPWMAHQLIQLLKLENVEFVVAPYEADAQLAYFSSIDEVNGGVSAVITEDSDLLAYGCRAVLFKMDRIGNAEEIVMDKVFQTTDVKPLFKNFDKELFTGMCILAGCDFLPSVPGIGIVKAHSFVSKYSNLDRVLLVLKSKKGNQMPEDYSKSFKEALTVFQHARIYDVGKKRLVHMTPLPKSLPEFFDEKLEFLGPEIPDSIAIAIAEGNLNPTTMEAFSYATSLRTQPDPVRTQNSGNLQGPGAAKVSKRAKLVKGFCFSGVTEGPETKQDSPALERKHIREALQLQKLVSLPKASSAAEPMTRKDIARKMPTNPFSIMRPVDEPVHIDAKPEEASTVTNNETPVTTGPPPVSICGSARSKKRKLDSPKREHSKIAAEEVSGMTTLEDPSFPGITANAASQESVNSKPRSKLKGSDRCKKGTILNFFSPV